MRYLRQFRVLAAIALAVGSDQANAQIKSSKDYDPVVRAEELIARAEAISNLKERAQAARLFEQAARVFPADHPRGVYALENAASARYYGGNTARAKQLFEEAAARAEARGDLTGAAESYISALFIAVERKERDDARRFMDRVVVLSASPTLPEADRVALLRRIAQPLAALTVKSPR